MRILMVLLLCVCRLFAADPTKSLADTLAENGVTQDNNIAGHAEERTADQKTGHSFDFNRVDLAYVWIALRNSSYLEIRNANPKAPYFFVVLNTDTAGRLDLNRPIEEFWIDSQDNAYFCVDHSSSRPTFQVFRARQPRYLMTAFADRRTPPGNYSLSVARVYEPRDGRRRTVGNDGVKKIERFD